MALRKILTKRLISDARGAKSPPSIPLCREHLISPDSDEKISFLRFLHRRALGHSAARLPEFLLLPIGEKIRETLRGSDIAGDRLGIGLLSPPPPPPSKIGDSLFGLSVSDAKKILRLAHMEKLKSKLRETSESSIPYSEFTRICVEACENEEQGAEFAKMLDQSGNVIVLGNVVFLRPEQVAKSMEAIISQSIDNPKDPRRKELEKLEKQKAIIDQKAREQVKGELYCGLGFVLVQTLAAMRLTFWELSWDVMEPICFFVTSVHFALGYGFFLKTSTEPTFQGYFQRRFQAKQKRLMALANFDFQRYTDLCKVFENHHRERKGQSLSAINQYC